jgi:hypothetical protein
MREDLLGELVHVSLSSLTTGYLQAGGPGIWCISQFKSKPQKEGSQ